MYVVTQYERGKPRRAMNTSQDFDTREEAEEERTAMVAEDTEMCGLGPDEMPWFYEIKEV